MRKMILSVISAVLIAGSASAADAAHHRRAVSKTAERAPTGAPFRNSNNDCTCAAGELPYSGYSAPAGR